SDRAAGVVLPADYTFKAADGGVHTFTNGATLITAGGQAVTVRDKAYITGATVTTTTVTVLPGQASTLTVGGLAGSVTAGPAGTFSAALVPAGMQILTATDTANAGLTGTQTGITVNAAAASVLLLSAPDTATIGVPVTVTVTLLDAYGNVATGYSGTVQFDSS